MKEELRRLNDKQEAERKQKELDKSICKVSLVISCIESLLYYSQPSLFTVILQTYNLGVGSQWFMTLKWICRCNDFLLFDQKMQNNCAAISVWFAMSESLISNLDKSTETCCRTLFPNQGFR